MDYNIPVIEIVQSDTFRRWLSTLRDRKAKARIHARLDRMADGNMGDIKPVGQGVSEARIDYGPGYRLYFIQRGMSVIVMLGGGDKSSQDRDIKRAKKLAEQWR